MDKTEARLFMIDEDRGYSMTHFECWHCGSFIVAKDKHCDGCKREIDWENSEI